MDGRIIGGQIDRGMEYAHVCIVRVHPEENTYRVNNIMEGHTHAVRIVQTERLSSVY